jgi:anti-sigma-K factor RskA
VSDQNDQNDQNDHYDQDHDMDELLGAYALDAVDIDERRRIEDYLESNPRAAAEVREHREVATMLAYTGMDAPDGLWDRIVSTIEEPAPEPGPELAKVLPMESPRRSTSPAASFGKWILATAAAAVIAIVAVSFVDRDATSDPLQLAVEEARADRDTRIAVLTAEGSPVEIEAVVDENGRGFLVADALPQLPRDQTYQLWGVVGDDVISLGILGPNPELEPFSARVELAALAVTIEPAGGVVSDGNPVGAYSGTLG